MPTPREEAKDQTTKTPEPGDHLAGKGKADVVEMAFSKRVYIKEGKHAVKWTRLSCISFRGNAVRLQLHALAYNLANFLRTLVLPAEVAQWSLTSLREKVVKIGAKVITHGRYLVFQMAEVAVPRELFRRLLDRIATLRPPAVARC